MIARKVPVSGITLALSILHITATSPEEQFCKHFERDEVFVSEGVFQDDFLKKYIALPIYLCTTIAGRLLSSVPSVANGTVDCLEWSPSV